MSLFLNDEDLNDYISPGQSCIKPVEIKTDENSQQGGIKIDDTGGYFEVTLDGEEKRLETASITLNDCLACSGCITSAESVLVSLQTYQELYNTISNNTNTNMEPTTFTTKTIVVSISPQSRASFAAKYNLTTTQIHACLTQFFKSIGCHYVFDTNFGRELALMEGIKEFLERQSSNSSNTQPILASSCPGWICYVEKTHPQLIPYLSTSKSPMAITGSIVKSFLCQHIQIPPERVYHVSIMPCFDKKLEASRSQLSVQSSTDPETMVRETDLVLTTGEVHKMLLEKNLDLRFIAREMGLDNTVSKTLLSETDLSLTLFQQSHSEEFALVSHFGSSSGGYLASVFVAAAKLLHGVNDMTPREVEMGSERVRILVGKNSDYKDIVLIDPSSRKVLLKMAYVYGFRNIQNLVRKLKPSSGNIGVGRGVVSSRRRAAAAAAMVNADDEAASLVGFTTMPYHYIEVMACPSGCVNGGGQLPGSVDSKDGQPMGVNPLFSNKMTVQAVESVYHSDAKVPGGGEFGVVDNGRLSWSHPDPRFATIVQEVAKIRGEKWTRTSYESLQKEQVNFSVQW